MTDNEQFEDTTIDESMVVTPQEPMSIGYLPGSQIMAFMLTIPLIIVGGICSLFYGFHDGAPMAVVGGIGCVILAAVLFKVQSRT